MAGSRGTVMNMVWIPTFASVFLVSSISLIGLLTLGMRPERLKALLIHFVSLAAGALFGDAFFHILPEISRREGFGLRVSLLILSGIVLFLVIEKAIHLYQYHGEIGSGEATPAREPLRSFVVVALLGDTIHNFGDGLIIGASYLVSFPIGVANTLAVAFHEIPHEIGNFSIFVHGGLSPKKAVSLNFLSALFAALGALAALLLSRYVGGIQDAILPVVAGGFIYVAGSDLIPELHREVHTTKKVLAQVAVFVAGIALMALLLLLD